MMSLIYYFIGILTGIFSVILARSIYRAAKDDTAPPPSAEAAILQILMY